MSAPQTDLTADDDDDAIIEAPSRVVSVALVPMETGLSAYSGHDNLDLDQRLLRAKFTALRALHEFPQMLMSELVTLLREFDLDRDVAWPPDDGEHDDEYDEALTHCPSWVLIGEVERYAEKEYGRIHEGEDWPEVAAEKARRRAENDAANERIRLEYEAGAFDRAVAAATRARADPVGASEPRNAVTRSEVPEPEPVAIDTGYSRRYRALVETVLRRIEACDTLDTRALIVARVMLDRADANTRETWQSAATIGRRAHMNEDTARDRIEALRRARIVEVARQGGRGPGNATRYRFLISNSQTPAGNR